MEPSTVPCGTPESTVTCWDDSPSNVTLIFLFVRKFASHLCTDPLIPYWSNLCSSFLWGTVSKVFEKSNIAMSICLPLSRYLELQKNP
jgi:hypothetical protein